MKKQLLTAILSLFVITAFTQVIEKDLSMSEGVQNALTLELNGADKKKAEKKWRDYAKEFGKIERNKKSNEYVISDAVIPAVDTEYPITVFTKFDEYDDLTRAYFWFKMDERFLNSIDDENEVNGIDVFLERYAVEVEKEVVKEELKEQEKQLKKLQRELSKLEKKEKNLKDDIEDAKKKIADSERELEQNVVYQKDMRAAIEEQEAKVKMVSDKMNKVGKS